ncbi:DNA-processing protein DprA [Magnetococcales bacterium HHB-1]
MDDLTLLRWLTFRNIPKLGPILFNRLWKRFGSIEKIWQADPEQLSQIHGVSTVITRSIEKARTPDNVLHQKAQKALETLRKLGADIIPRSSPHYPDWLKRIPDPPIMLFTLGDKQLLNHPLLIAVVGARKASLEGKKIAEKLAFDMVQHNIVVVSGLAYGIDAAAHEGALKRDKHSIAVLPNGLDICYPQAHKGLKARIRKQGCLISELPPGVKPAPYLFPARNRIITGLSQGVVIVEAALPSGSIATAHMALNQNREVFAVPGSILNPLNQGCHQLIRDGACLTENLENIQEALRWDLGQRFSPPKTQEIPSLFSETFTEPAAKSSSENHKKDTKKTTDQTMPTPVADASDEENALLQFIHQGIHTGDELARESGLPVTRVSTLLLQLELSGTIKRLPGNLFTLP